jgi:cytochrome P450
MLCILTSPNTYQTLQSELTTHASRLSRPVVRDSEARSLPYLQATILESLRVHPPTGGLLSKVTPPNGDTVDGVFVPGGVKIATNTWALMRNKELFGADVEFFRPERWLGVDKGRYDEMSRVVDMAFGSGKYKCLGRTVAWMELNKIFVEVRELCFEDSLPDLMSMICDCIC